MKIKEYLSSRLSLKILFNLYPPLFFNRIILKKISADYRKMTVVIKKTIFNINFHKTIFGGTIFSACDPFFPTMYYYIFKNKNCNLIIWVKNAEINYLQPADTSLLLEFKINESQIKDIEKGLKLHGKYEVKNEVNALNKKKVICANAQITTYLRDPNFIN